MVVRVDLHPYHTQNRKLQPFVIRHDKRYIKKQTSRGLFSIHPSVSNTLSHIKDLRTMFTTASTIASRRLTAITTERFFSNTTAMGKKVCVLGAGGGIGQPLSLLLKLSTQVSELSCYDIVGTPGVAADLSHIPTASHVTGNLPAATSWPPKHNTGLEAALTGASVVVIPAGVPRKPGMTRDDLFNTNASKFTIMTLLFLLLYSGGCFVLKMPEKIFLPTKRRFL